MAKPYRLVVFDWEGTLGDTLGQIFNSVAVEAKRLKLGKLDEELARQYVDLGLVNALRKIFPHLNERQHKQLLSAVQRSLVARTTEVFLIPGAKDFVNKLHLAGISLAIASNKGQHALQRAIQQAKLEQLFKLTRSADQSPAKPAPDMLAEIMEVTGVDADETLMIGDSVTDIQMANCINVDAIGVDFYHQHRTALLAAGALAVFDSYQQVIDYLDLPKKESL